MNQNLGLRLDRLRNIRVQRGIAQRELARRCGLSDSMIQKYETGLNDPTSHILKLISEQLEVSVDYLLGITDDPRVELRDPSLADEERAILESYRREGWPGVLHLGAEHMARLTRAG